MDEVYNGFPGILVLVVDILVFGHTAQEHDQNLQAMLQKPKKKGVKLNPGKKEVDASQSGLGAMLMQNGVPVTYASKSLNQTEQRYARIEKEMYAVVFGCERFHQYIYGRHVKVHTDHKPLEAIQKKPLAVAPASIQKYDLEITYKPGKTIPVADTLSRHYPSQTSQQGKDDEIQVHAVMRPLPIADKKIQL